MSELDVVIVGGGLCGAILALELATAGKTVVILEAGPGDPSSRQGYQRAFLEAGIKLPESPYPPYEAAPDKQNAPRATSAMLFGWPSFQDMLDPNKRRIAIDAMNWGSHLTYDPERATLPFMSTYERILGGTTWHWLGTSLRLLPNDFKMRSRYGQAVDWPLGYDDLVDDYGRAEHLIGVSADIADQAYLGIRFPPGYGYPMPRIPPSYSDSWLDAAMRGLRLPWLDNLEPRMANTPQGRNSIFYDNRRACEGNTSCIPICPIEAKYDATQTLRKAVNTGRVTIVPKTVATRIKVDPASGRATSVDFTSYTSEQGGPRHSGTMAASVIVVAAHAIETARLLLMSTSTEFPNGVANASDQVGRNLMDHVVYLSWGLAKEPVYPFRGPRSSGGIESLRDGPFRKDFAAFRVDVGNEGWGWADDDPNTVTRDFVDGTDSSRLNPHHEKLFGRDLVARLNDRITRMVRFCYLVEQPPDPANRVTLSTRYKDGLDLPRPQIQYGVSDYTLKGLRSAEKATEAIFAKAGIDNYTRFHGGAGYPAVAYTDEADVTHFYNLYGAGHIMGTYRMGSDPKTSVVNSDLQAHDHANLFLLGSGTFPTTATGNPTLTLAALTFRASRAILKKL
jgi:choline dehydrogenase-like flavoprotein